MIRHLIAPLLVVTLIASTGCSRADKPTHVADKSAPPQTSTRFARYVGENGKPTYGIVENDNLREISAAPWDNWKQTNRRKAISVVKFLPVTAARNVYAMAGNYKDHLVGATPERLEKAKTPQFFMKSTSCLAGNGDDIRLP